MVWRSLSLRQKKSLACSLLADFLWFITFYCGFCESKFLLLLLSNTSSVQPIMNLYQYVQMATCTYSENWITLTPAKKLLPLFIPLWTVQCYRPSSYCDSWTWELNCTDSCKRIINSVYSICELWNVTALLIIVIQWLECPGRGLLFEGMDGLTMCTLATS